LWTTRGDAAPPLRQRAQRDRHHHDGGREHHHPQHHHRAPGHQLQQENVNGPARAVFARSCETTGVGRSKAGQPPAEGEVPGQLAYGLVVGKFAHALAAVACPRLSDEENASTTWSKLQVAFNNVVRSITGYGFGTTSRSPT
jgi:hypothetical protein